MKRKNKILALLLSLCMLILMCPSVMAADRADDKLFDEYQSYVEKGIIGSDISYEYWRYLKEESLNLEKELGESDEFVCVYDTMNIGLMSTYSMEAGDIFITNGTSSAGILGHAGIAISSKEILSIAGPGCKPDTWYLYQWNSLYSYKEKGCWTKIYRHSNKNVAQKAANWASSTYKGKSATYKITKNLTTTNETYCSKIVWQAYYYGPDTPVATGKTNEYRLPYGLPDKINNLSIVKTYLKD